jgi:formylglycine-generating enzyme required for sulfatase activity
MVPRLTIQGSIGATNQIQYCTNVSQPNWVVLTNLVVVQSPYRLVDVEAPPAPQRFYRVLKLTNNAAPSGMFLIPAGSFTMGNCMNSGEGDSNELPLHTVNVSAFYMATNLVSKALWDQVYGWAVSHGYSIVSSSSGKATNHPVQTVSWYDVVKWCNARSEQEGLTPVITRILP